MEHGSFKHHGTALQNPTAWRKRQQTPVTPCKSVCVCVHVCELELEPQCLYSMIDDYLYVHEHFSGEISACL